MTITVQTLIVTLCSADRRDSILRAIESAQSQRGTDVTPVVVINGQRYRPELREELEARRDITVHYLTEGNLFAARRFAREAVTADYFCWLDDDDIYLPGAMERRLAPMLENPAVDAVIGNGYIREGADRRLLFDSARAIESDPVAALFRQNWLAAAGGLYRTAAISPDYFDPSVRSLDMTHLALRLATEKTLRFLDAPTFRKNKSAGSLSTTDAWMLPAKDTLRAMLEVPMTRRCRRLLREKIGEASHALSDYYRRDGDGSRAWTNHLSSLASPGGMWRYGAYTRRLISLSLAQAIGRTPAPQ